MISRRTLLSIPIVSALGATACRQNKASFRGYAFIANQEGEALAALDLEVMAVSKHIPLKGAPSDVLTSRTRPVVYALTPDNGTVHEISTDTLKLARQVTVASKATISQGMALSADEKMLYVATMEPRGLVAVALEGMSVAWRVRLPEAPLSLTLSLERASDGTPQRDLNIAAVSFGTHLRLIGLAGQHVSDPLPASQQTSQETALAWGQVRFLSDGLTLVAANLAVRQLSLFRVGPSDVNNAPLITNLPIAVRPDNLCFNRDGGQLFVTGEGMDAVVIVYPYDTPRVAETVLAGHAPGVMGVSKSLLFVASPESGDVSILNIPTRKVIAVTQVGSDPGFIAVTPDDQYALVLNRKSGDVAVMRVPDIQPNRYKAAGLLTVIPVGSKPVSAALRAVS